MKERLRLLSRLLPLLLLLLAAPGVHAQSPSPLDNELHNPQLRQYLRLAWGLEAGSSIDLTTQDMSTLNADAFVGLRAPWFDVLGVGAGIHAMVNNNSFSYPIYALVRTTFSRRPGLCFFELRAGVSVNSFFSCPSQIGFYANPGIGIHLAMGPRFHSYLAVGYCYNGASVPLPDGPRAGVSSSCISALSFANVRLGVSF